MHFIGIQTNKCFLDLTATVGDGGCNMFLHCCETVTSGLRTQFVSSLICARCETSVGLSIITPPTNWNGPWLLPPSLPAECHRLGGVEESCLSSCCCLSVHVHLFFLLLLLPLLLLPHVVQSCSFLPGSTMERGELLAVCLLCWSCTLSVVTAIQRADLFPYGSLNGDLVLAEGDDETSKVLSLPRPLYFYDSSFSQLYVSKASLINYFVYCWVETNFQSAKSLILALWQNITFIEP